METATWCPTPAACSAASRLRVDVVKNASTASSSQTGALETSTTTSAPAITSARPSPVMVSTPVPGDAATASCPRSASRRTTLPPTRPVPPITTIFMTFPPVVVEDVEGRASEAQARPWQTPVGALVSLGSALSMAHRDRPRGLVGRRSECETLDRLLRSLRSGDSQVLVVRGDAGIGKTALLEYVAERASGCRVARAGGVESEMELPFAGLHQLCAPMLDGLDGLPGPQQDALRVAFGLKDGPAPDHFLVALAVLSLLGEAAEPRPLVCLVDDAQWLDRGSAQALAFVARRLLAERIAMVFAVREPHQAVELAGLPELVVQGIADGDARALLSSAVPGILDERIRDRIVAETRGNPLGLLELPLGSTPAELAGGFGLPAAMPLANRIERGFLRRFESLPR